MGMDISVDKVIEVIERKWHKPVSLIVVIPISWFILFFVLNQFDVSKTFKIIAFITVSLCIFILWLHYKRIPKTPKGKVGFAVSIQCPDESEQRKICDDFIVTLNGLVEGGKIGSTFHFIYLPQHISASINNFDDAHKLIYKTNSIFLIFGRVRLRKIGGNEHHVLDLNGVVRHNSARDEMHTQLNNEFGELFPKRINIASENDLLAFDFTSNLTDCIAKYIIGIASFISLELDYSEKLFQDVQRKLDAFNTDLPTITKLRERIPIRLSEIHMTMALILLQKWQSDRNTEVLKEVRHNLDKIDPAFEGQYQYLLLSTNEAFLNGRRIEEALEYAKRCKKYDDPSWHFNIAFLEAYRNNLKLSIQQYRICEKYEILPRTLSEIEDFLVWIIKEEPDKYQFYYCLGFFNWKIKGDLKKAIDDFERFKQFSMPGEFEKELSLTRIWLPEIKSKLNQFEDQ